MPKHNLPRLQRLAFSTFFIPLLPVLVPFFQSKGMGMTEIFSLNAIFGLSVAVFELPTGYIADMWGRRRALILGTCIKGVAFSMLPFVDGFWQFVVYEILIGIGFSFVSGNDFALYFDSLQYHPVEKREGLIARVQANKSWGEALASLIGGALASVSMTAVVIGNAIAGWLPAANVATLKEAEYTKMRQKTHRERVGHIYSQLFMQTPKVRFMLLNIIVWSSASFFMVWAYQKYWQEQGIGIGWFGLLWALQNALVAVTCRLVPRFEKRFGLRFTLILVPVTVLVGYGGMGLLTGWIGVVMGFFFLISRGIMTVSMTSQLNQLVPSEFRATANSIASLGMRVVFGVFGPLIGYGLDHYGFRVTLVTLGCLFALIAIALFMPLLKMIPKTRLHGAN